MNEILIFPSLQCRRILARSRASALIKRAPESWIQTRKRLGERRKCVLGRGSYAEKRSNGGGGGEGKIRLPVVVVFSRNAVRSRTESVIGAVSS